MYHGRFTRTSRRHETTYAPWKREQGPEAMVRRIEKKGRRRRKKKKRGKIKKQVAIFERKRREDGKIRFAHGSLSLFH